MNGVKSDDLDGLTCGTPVGWIPEKMTRGIGSADGIVLLDRRYSFRDGVDRRYGVEGDGGGTKKHRILGLILVSVDR